MEDSDSILKDINTEREASYFQRLFAILFDVVIEISVIAAIYFLIPREILLKLLGINPFMKYVIAILIVLLYRTICILLFDKTIGMILCRLKYLNSNFQPLSSKEKLIAIIATKTSKVKFFETK